MRRTIASGVLAAAVLALGACGSRESTAPTAPTTTNTNSGDVDPEDPKAGMNTNRPDSSKDVKPGTDAPPGSN